MRRVRISASCIKLISAYIRQVKHTLGISISHADADLLAKLKTIKALSGSEIFSRYYDGVLEKLPAETAAALHSTIIGNYGWYESLAELVDQNNKKMA